MKKMALGGVARLQVLAMTCILACVLSLSVSSFAFAEGQATADSATADNWAVLNYDSQEGRTTKNDGRIWTDKSVYTSDATVMAGEDSDITVQKSDDASFLVGLSALSSTMSVDGVSSKPLDIVLVLDVSGSMEDGMGYTEVYADDMTYQGSYYIKRNNGYTQLRYSHNNQAWYYQNGNRNVYVTPKTSAEDATSGAVQVYKLASKMEALSDSVKGFIASTEEMNSNASDAAMKHRISLVKFSGNTSNKIGNDTYTSGGHAYNYSQVVKGFVTVDEASAAELSSAVDELTPAGATRADNGMAVAEGVLEGARSNAQQVVIFFTDGVPTSFSDWDAGVANAAIESSKNMKDGGAWVYSLGVFADSDPTGDDSLNRYMNAISSNYPNATGYTSKTMGARVDASQDYYHTAADASELEGIFRAIATEIAGKSAKVPTHIEEGYDTEKGGYVTFVDKLGDYMEVSSFNSIVFDGVEYKNELSAADFAAADGSTDVFVSDARLTNNLGEEVSAGSIVATIQRSDNPRTGDVITVKIPAALIPLAYYDVNIKEGKATTVRTATTPVRAFYEVSLKDEARTLLAQPDADMLDYLSSHTNDEGQAVFYSNAYDAAQNAEIGSTVASFVPSQGNTMYYIAEDTLIFADKACTVPVTSINEAATYYYQRVYYIEGEELEPQHEVVAFSASVLKNVSYGFTAEGQLYVKAGQGRYTRADAVDTAKGADANKTATAETAAASRWEDWNTPGSAVSVFLGNNGLLTCDVPGTLAISKDVVLPGWATVEISDAEFTFNVTLKTSEDKPLQGSFRAQVKNEAGQNVGDAFDVVTDDEGRATVALKDGQTLYVYGLPDKTMYTVSESDIPAGFAQTSPVDEAGQPMDASGMVYAGKTYAADFENTYKATGTLKGAENLKGEKVLEGREWRDSDVFAFALAPEDADNPMPANAELIDGVYMAVEKVSGEDADKAFSFGDIVYTEPGTYLYDINEVVIPGIADRVPGVSYSQAVYEVTVVVTDNGDGTLKVDSSMKLFGGEAASQGAVFKNTFEQDKVVFAIEGLKQLTDKAGAYQIKDDDFSFELTALTEGAPMPKGAVDGVYATTNKGISVSFGSIECELSKEAIENAGGSVMYTYQVKELKGSIPGMQYDEKAYKVDVTFTWDDEDGLLFTMKYPENDKKWVTFSNTYDLEDVVVELEGIKYLKGRDWKDGEEFTFQLKGLNGAPMPEAAQGADVYEFTVDNTVTKDNYAIFGKSITYSKAGTYVYELSEVRGTAAGMTYDSYVSTITVTVSDNGEGELVAKKSVEVRTDVASNAGVSGFVNTYEASMTYAGLNVEKTLYGRDMTFGEFDFVIEAANPNAKSKGIALPEEPLKIESGAHAAGEVCVMDGSLSGLTFDQDDAGKEFIYKVNEVLPVDDDVQHEGIQSSGVTYDETEYWVVIVPVDNGDATMHATTKVYTEESRENLVGEWNSNNQEIPTVSFENEYGFKDVSVDTLAEAFFTKTFEGREWTDADTFKFQMKAITKGAPMPEGAADGVATVTVGKPDFGNQAVVDFGVLVFEEAGTYVYEIAELVPADADKLPGVAYDSRTATLTIKVEDNGGGNLVASSSVENGAFKNTFETEVNYGATTTLDVVKSLEGRELRAQQFSFTVKPGDIPSMNKVGMTSLNGMEFTNGAPGADGKSHMFSPSGIVFTQEDMGKTFTYIFAEINEGEAGYSYDKNEYAIEMTPSLTEDHKVQVQTVVKKNGEVVETVVGVEGVEKKPVVVIEFKNTYESEGAYAVIEGEKTMTGRGLADGEFEFVLAYAADEAQTPVATAGNSQDGSVVFEDQTYTLESLAELVESGYAVKAASGLSDVYTVNYVAFEKAGDENGVTHTNSTFACAVKVTDDGKGNLTSEVLYPEGGLAFENVYSAGEPVEYQVKGLKVLDVPAGLSPESIEGKFSFTLEAVTEGAPLPQNTVVTNDALGNIDFGTISFSQDLLEGVEQDGKVRTVQYKYAVTESGSAAGITNDAEATKYFTLELADDGEGEMKVVWLESSPVEGPLFTFANHYGVEETSSSVTDQVSISKVLEGRKLVEGEFEFELLENGEVVASGSNDKNGVVTLSAITYTEPCEHVYVVREVSGELGGVEYDKASYQVKTVVSDNGDGTLSVAHDLVDAEEVVFTNSYSAEPASLIVGVGKELEGRSLLEGEFEFKMTPLTEGAPMPESDIVPNDAEGIATFAKMTFFEVGVYEYELSEVKGSVEGVTYDESVYPMTVTVTDTGEGYLDLDVDFGGKVFAPVFVNSYEDPKDPEDPEDPEDPVNPDNPEDPEDSMTPGESAPGEGANAGNGANGAGASAFAKTSDGTGALIGVVAVVAAAAAVVGIVAWRRMRRSF